MRKLLALGVVLVFASTAPAAFMFEIDTDGLDDGVLTYNPNFSFGGDTTSASQSAKSNAPFTTGGDSIFGGNGSAFDTYVYSYAPDAEPDNVFPAYGESLGEGSTATGVVGGGAGVYAIYATWPYTSNVTGGLTNYEVVTNGFSATYSIDQNNHGHAWIPIGTVTYTDGPITITQNSTTATYTSMRAYGLLFEAIPEPASLALLALGGLVLVRRR